jgi:DNA repair protein RadC
MSARAATDEPAHYHGHRARLRQRLLQAGSEAVADYELVELVPFRAIPRRDVKPLAKALIARFGSFAEAIAAEPARLAEIEGMSEGAIAEFKIVEASAKRFAKGAVRKRLPVGSFSAVVDYCRTAMAFDAREEFRVLFLDRKNGLIAHAPSTRRRSIHAKSCVARSNCRRPRSSASTITPPAIPRRRPRTSR